MAPAAVAYPALRRARSPLISARLQILPRRGILNDYGNRRLRRAWLLSQRLDLLRNALPQRALFLAQRALAAWRND